MFNLSFIPYNTFHLVDINTQISKILAQLYLPQLEVLGSKKEAHQL